MIASAIIRFIDFFTDSLSQEDKQVAAIAVITIVMSFSHLFIFIQMLVWLSDKKDKTNSYLLSIIIYLFYVKKERSMS